MANVSKKTIDAWRRFLISPEGQEGLEELQDLMPITAIDPAPHVMTYHAGMVDGYRYCIKKIWDSLATPAVKEEKVDSIEPLERVNTR